MTDIDTSGNIRVAAGHIAQSTILGSSSYLLENLPIQSDSVYPHWQGWIEGNVSDGVIEVALSGAGGLYGKLSGTLTLSVLTPDMQDYWFTNIMQGKYRAPVTLYFHHPRYKFITVNCYMEWFASIAQAGTQQTNTILTNVPITWDRGVILGNAHTSGFSRGFT